MQAGPENGPAPHVANYVHPYRAPCAPRKQVSMSKLIRTLDATVTSRSATYPEPKPMSVSLVFDGGYLLRFELGGSWFVSTLIGVDGLYSNELGNGVRDVHCIDFGQEWTVTGMRKVLAEALALILSGKAV